MTNIALPGKKNWITGIARAGFIAKGMIYLVLGALAFMAAFELGGQSEKQTSQSGVFTSVKEWPGGMFLLVLLTAGLACYTIWRFIQAFNIPEKDQKKKWGKRVRYIFSGIAYLLLAFSALQLILHSQSQDNGDSKQYWAAEILSKPFGQWLLGIAALGVAATGIYQLWYGISEHYKKHVEEQNISSSIASRLVLTGKIGYISRGIVWLMLAWLLMQAAIHANPGEAGGTSKAFTFLEEWSAGSILLALLALGLIAYGIFNFVRAAYERFE